MDYDVEIYDDGSIVLITPVTEPVIDWADVNIEGDPAWGACSYAVERRYAVPIIEAMIREGFSVDA